MHLLNQIDRQLRFIHNAKERQIQLELEHINLDCSATTKLCYDAIQMGVQGAVPVTLHYPVVCKYKAKHKLSYELFLLMPFVVFVMSWLCFALSGLFAGKPWDAFIVASMSAVITMIGEVSRQYRGMQKELERMREYHDLLGDYNTRMMCTNLLLNDFVRGYKNTQDEKEFKKKCAEFIEIFNTYEEIVTSTQDKFHRFGK